MDVKTVGHPQPSERAGSLGNPTAQIISRDPSGSAINSMSLAEDDSTTADVEIVPDCMSLPAKASGKQADSDGEDGWKAQVQPFRSMREFAAERMQHCNDFVTDESGPLGLLARNARDIISQSTNANSNTNPIGLIHGFFTLPLNTAISSITATKCKPYNNLAASLALSSSLETTRDFHAKNQEGLVELASTSLVAHIHTPNPCHGISCGPHVPPRPADSYHPQRKNTPAIFHDQFTQFMEDRMAMFQPSSSQNNVEQSLSLSHPYQQADEVESMHLRSWFTLNPHRPSAVQDSPQNDAAIISANSPSSIPPVNNSTSSFLPRGVQGPGSAEPAYSSMVYTPRAVPLAEMKRPPLSPIPSQFLS